MIEQDCIMLIMNCVKYEKMETVYRFDEVNHVLWVKTPDDYNSLPNKVITSYQAINETFNFKSKRYKH